MWAKPDPEGDPDPAYDHSLVDGDEVFDGWRVTDMERDDEVALWLPEQRALLFGDAMLRRTSGELRPCPESWTQPAGGPERLRAILREQSRPPSRTYWSHTARSSSMTGPRRFAQPWPDAGSPAAQPG